MMEVIEKVATAAKNLIPPAEGASEVHVKRWRLWIAAATFLNAAGLSIHIALACGFAAPFYTGFAQAGEVEGVRAEMAEVKTELRVKRINELGGLLLDAKAKQCAATGEAKRLYLSAYNNLRTEYYNLIGREYPDPPCSDFN
jgi:hypothetical protein